MLAETRRIEIAERLRATGAVTIAEVGERYGVSRMTARPAASVMIPATSVSPTTVNGEAAPIVSALPST